jgi:drug/metabolite transporter (DMT)-like permease
MHAGWNLIAKRGHDVLVAMALIKVPNIAMAIGILAFMGLPPAAVWPWMLASTAVNCLYFYFLINAYRVGDLSLAYPVSRGMAPLLVLLLSLALAGEVPSAAAAAGVLLICIGIFALAARRGASRQHVHTLAWAAGVGFCIATYTVTDGIGARASGNPIAYVAVLNIFTGIGLISVAAWRRGPAFKQALRTDWLNGVIGGALMLGAYTIVVFALTKAPMAQVSALREASVIFAAILGAIFLKEPFGGRRIAASVAVAAGIGMLALGK